MLPALAGRTAFPQPRATGCGGCAGRAIFLLFQFMTSESLAPANPAASSEIRAFFADHEIVLDAAHPAAEWENARPVTFTSDWQGKNSDTGRETQVQALWSEKTLFLRFKCRYRGLFVFGDADPGGRRNHLWERDVAEAFLQPEPAREQYYREFEVSPNGMWIDLDIFPGGLSDLQSGMLRSVFLDEKAHVWIAELAIPIRALTQRFDAKAIWRVNFYRVEGTEEPRAYLAWQPTNTPEPNFHVPRAFGRMLFVGIKAH
jgi:alpha-galactosidase